jgi:phosphomannomutase / phosphoglucomutase
LNINKDIFRAYDIRGIYPDDLNEETFLLIGKAIGKQITEQSDDPKVSICMDGRISGPSLKQSLISGLTFMGVNVIDIGSLPTPLLYYSLKKLNINNGLMITGSHNPSSYNGIKMVINNKTLFDNHIIEIYKSIISDEFNKNKVEGKLIKNDAVLDSYIKDIKVDINIKSKLKVSIDCGNGITGAITRKVFGALNINFEIIYENVDGSFPNHPPDPTDERNLLELKNNIIKNRSDIGFAYDGDGDRICVVTKDCKMIWPDQLLMLYSRSILKNSPGKKIVYDIKCSKHVEKEIVKNSGVPILSKTGHSFIKKAIIEENASLGGEMSGHIFFADRWGGFDDGIYASLRLLEILCEEGDNLNILNTLPKSITTPEINIPFKGNNHFTFMNLFAKLAKFNNASIIDIDGIKIIYPDSWGLIRCSNTTSNLVLRFEADDRDAMSKIQSLVKDEILKIDDKIELPF